MRRLRWVLLLLLMVTILMLLSRSGCCSRRRVLFILERISTYNVRALVDVFDDALHERRRQVSAATAATVRQSVRYSVTVELSSETLQTHAGVLVVANTYRIGGYRPSAARNRV